jgi:hypothetical protein
MKWVIKSGLWLFAIGAVTIGCSAPYRSVHVSDAAIHGDELVLLLYAQSGVTQSAFLHHGSPRKKLQGALGIGTCSLTRGPGSLLTLVGQRDASKEPLLQTTYDLMSTGSCLVATRDGLLKAEIVGNRGPDKFIDQTKNARYWLTPNRRVIVVCGDKPRALDADNLKGAASQLAQRSASVLCQSPTNSEMRPIFTAGGSMGPIFAVSDDLNAIALQDVNRTETWNRLVVWDFTKGTNPQFVRIPGDLLNLEAIQLVNGKIRLLLSNRMKTPEHPRAVLFDEDGKTLGETEMFGLKPIVDSSFDRIVFLTQATGGIRIKVWYPKLSKEDILDISCAQAFEKLYGVWNNKAPDK